MWNEHFHIVTDHTQLTTRGYSYGIRPRIVYRKFINPKFDIIVMSELGQWLHNKYDDECIRTFHTLHKRDMIIHKLDQFGIPMKRLPHNPCP